MNIFIDIETIPAQSTKIRDEILAEVEDEKAKIKAPANYKDSDKVAEYISIKRAELDLAAEDRWRRTSFDGAYGQIVCISAAIDDLQPESFYYDDYEHPFSERRTIGDLFDWLSNMYEPSRMMRPVFIGHNVIQFDLRFLHQRAMINGICPPSFIPRNPKPWDVNVFDTMTEWAGSGNRISLDKLCRVFGIPTKGTELDGEEIDGSKVWDFVAAGRIADVAKYCAGDVERVRSIYKRMTYQS